MASISGCYCQCWSFTTIIAPASRFVLPVSLNSAMPTFRYQEEGSRKLINCLIPAIAPGILVEGCFCAIALRENFFFLASLFNNDSINFSCATVRSSFFLYCMAGMRQL